MSRLIDADKLKAHYSWWKGGTRELTMDEAKSDFDTIIDLQPTAVIDGYEMGYSAGEKDGYREGVKETDEYDIYQHGYADGFHKGYFSAKGEYDPKHGKNLSADYASLFECSVCGYINDDTYCGKPTTFNYCPNCGARMDGAEE